MSIKTQEIANQTEAKPDPYFFVDIADKETVEIHPALDFTEDTAYIGILLDCKEATSEIKKYPVLLTEKEAFQCTPEELGKRNITTKQFGLIGSSQRWSTEGIKRFGKESKSVPPMELYAAIRKALTEYIEFQADHYYDLVTLWSIGTYFFPLFNSYPYLYVGGFKESGKTKLLTLCSCIAFNAVFSGSITTACLYRLIQSSRCTLVIDENEELADPQRNEEFKRILRNGYKKGSSVVRSDMSTEDFTPRQYETYGPKILANIGGLDDVLGSRCISIPMEKSLNKEITKKEIDIDGSTWQNAKDLLYPFVLKNWRLVRQSYSDLEDQHELYNREWELWKPILAMAKTFGTEIYDKIVAFAKEKAKERENQIQFEPEYDLCEGLLHMVEQDDYYRLGSIKFQISWNYGKDPYWLTEKYLGGLLRRAGFKKWRRTAHGYEYFITVPEVKAFARKLGIKAEGNEHNELGERTAGQGTPNTNQNTTTETARTNVTP